MGDSNRLTLYTDLDQLESLVGFPICDDRGQVVAVVANGHPLVNENGPLLARRREMRDALIQVAVLSEYAAGMRLSPALTAEIRDIAKAAISRIPDNVVPIHRERA